MILRDKSISDFVSYIIYNLLPYFTQFCICSSYCSYGPARASSSVKKHQQPYAIATCSFRCSPPAWRAAWECFRMKKKKFRKEGRKGEGGGPMVKCLLIELVGTSVFGCTWSVRQDLEPNILNSLPALPFSQEVQCS